MMQENEVKALRDAVKQSNSSDMFVIWQNVDGQSYTVSSVPERPCDPDNTGTPDFIAILDGKGYVDLSNADPASFMLARPLFGTVA